MVVNPGDKISKRFYQQSKEMLLEKETNDYFYGKYPCSERLIMVTNRNIDYEKLSDKYGTILVRRVGTFTVLTEDDIVIDEKIDTTFPVDNFGDIVICENAQFAEKKWAEYLNKRFPNKTIATINFFKSREIEEIKKYFEKASIVTFSTTFSDFEWFKKMISCLDNQKVIGFSENKDGWQEALSYYSDIDIVEL